MLAGFIHVRVRVTVLTIVSGIKKSYATLTLLGFAFLLISSIISRLTQVVFFA